jgi:hypothetical protein
LTAKFLKSNGEVVERNTFHHLRQDKYESKYNKKVRSEFDQSVTKREGEPLSDKDIAPEFDVLAITPAYEVYKDDNSVPLPIHEVDPVVNDSDWDPEVYDGYITAQVLLPKGDEFKIGTIVRRRVDEKRNPTGRSNPNPILDTREYEVAFDHGSVLEYAANVNR